MSGVLGNISTAIYKVFDRAWIVVCWPLIGVLSRLDEICDLGTIIDKQMTVMKDAISSETKSHLEDIKKSLLRPA